VIGAGLDLHTSANLSFFVRYDGAYSGQGNGQTGTLGLKYAW